MTEEIPSNYNFFISLISLRYLFIYLSYCLESDDSDEIEDQSITLKQQQKSLNGLGSSAKRTMVANHESISKKTVLSDSSNSIHSESRSKPSDNSQDGIIIAFIIVYLYQTNLLDSNMNQIDVEETNDTEGTMFVSYKEHAKLKRKLNLKEKEYLALEKKVNFMKHNYMRK